jgi:hypothetical protein
MDKVLFRTVNHSCLRISRIRDLQCLRGSLQPMVVLRLDEIIDYGRGLGGDQKIDANGS